MRLAAIDRRTFLALATTACASAAEPADPDPPQLHDPGPTRSPAPKPHPATTFHSKPKPLPPGAKTEEWPQFLGPRRNMVSGETGLLRDLPADGPPLLWEFEKGTGYSSPTIAAGRLLYLHRLADRERVECLHPETGESFWSFDYPTDFSDRYGYNDGPRASAAIDGERVYAYGAQGRLHCLRLADGALLWRRDIASEFRVPQDFFGTASTPLIDGDALIVNVGAPAGPCVAAFDKLDGSMLWGAGEEWGPSYASPVAADIHGRRKVFVFAGGESRPPTGGLLMIDAETGKLDFSFPWRSRSYESVNAATPVVVGNEVLISATYRTGAALLRIQPDFSFEKAWESSELDLHWTTPIEEDGYYYAFAGRNEPDAVLRCVEGKTGRTQWSEVLEWAETLELNGRRRTLSASPFRGSLLAIDGRWLALGELGHLLWLDLSPDGVEMRSRAKLFFARETWSPPIVSRGLLYVSQNTRSFDQGKPPRLLCYDLRASAA